jgi:hypothetical protein
MIITKYHQAYKRYRSQMMKSRARMLMVHNWDQLDVIKLTCLMLRLRGIYVREHSYREVYFHKGRLRKHKPVRV